MTEQVEYIIMWIEDNDEFVCIRDDGNEREAIYSGLSDGTKAMADEIVQTCVLWAEVEYGSILPWIFQDDEIRMRTGWLKPLAQPVRLE